jgi:hypothetical protein
MNVLIANPIEDAVERCVTSPGYRVGVIVSSKEEKYSVENAVGKAVFSVCFKKTDNKHQLTRFRKSERGFTCEFIDGGSTIDCIILENNDTVRGRKYNMLISTNDFDERTRVMISPYITHEGAQGNN